jgi:hypothetical protein
MSDDPQAPLAWWAKHEDEFPRVMLMARQFLAIQAASADIERLFSKAGRAYASLAKCQNEGTLEARLFAGINVSRMGDYDDDSDDDDDWAELETLKKDFCLPWRRRSSSLMPLRYPFEPCCEQLSAAGQRR